MIANSDSVSCSYVLLCEGPHLIGVHNINMRGMLQCRFNQFNKIISMEIVFDVMGFMQQFQVLIYIVLFIFSFLIILLESCNVRFSKNCCSKLTASSKTRISGCKIIQLKPFLYF